MDRIDEIKVIVQHLEKEVLRIGKEYPLLFNDTVIKHGKLLEKYNSELKELQSKLKR